jgi:adenosylmethionine-8-amino-7-oxononanoate aminotransferase
MKLWFPYKQMKNLEVLLSVQSAQGAVLHMENGTSLIDGISSWWAVIHGYNHREINQALIDQINQVSHVMLGGLSHQPAAKLAETLVRITPEGLNHVFFSDSGSIGVEVALKMALQYFKNEGYTGKTKIVSLKNGYHGDTFKAMEVSDDSDFTNAFDDVLHRGFFVSIPSGGFNANNVDVETAVNEVEMLFKQHAATIACFIVEPIIQCAGGMNIYSPRYLQEIRRLCDEYDVLLIFDEVATGFGRTGKLFAAEHATVSPDIMIIGKAMTAGYIGHAATLASTKVFDSFLGDTYEKALMHGPTFMGNPLACTVALKSIEIVEDQDYLSKIANIERIILEQFEGIQSDLIKEKRVLGAIGVIEMKDAESLIGFNKFCQDKGVWLRPIGNILYLMPPYIISDAELATILQVIREWINKL